MENQFAAFKNLSFIPVPVIFIQPVGRMMHQQNAVGHSGLFKGRCHLGKSQRYFIFVFIVFTCPTTVEPQKRHALNFYIFYPEIIRFLFIKLWMQFIHEGAESAEFGINKKGHFFFIFKESIYFLLLNFLVKRKRFPDLFPVHVVISRYCQV